MFITEKRSKLDSAALVFNALMIRKNFTPFLPLYFSVLFHKKGIQCD
ncbi:MULTISPECIES: hypothetical protein [Helicobacter]|nr:hypothetical protein [Helicobacter sp. UBA3407]